MTKKNEVEKIADKEVVINTYRFEMIRAYESLLQNPIITDKAKERLRRIIELLKKGGGTLYIQFFVDSDYKGKKELMVL